MNMNTVSQNLSGLNAVVTGGSTGIGEGVALGFARAGADVVVGYCRSRENAGKTVETIRRMGRRAEAIQVDVSDPQQVEAFGEAAQAALGSLHIWANLAGTDILTGDNARLPHREKLARLLMVDLRGTMECSWQAARLLGKGGVILNTSWDQALRGMAGREAEMFAAVKGGITGFSLSLARSLAPDIRVNVLAPGWIETSFARQDLPPDAYREIAGQTPLGRFGLPEDVAQAAVYLASPAASFITGQTLMVNGGLVS